jgi:hypothetical protein
MLPAVVTRLRGSVVERTGWDRVAAVAGMLFVVVFVVGQ